MVCNFFDPGCDWRPGVIILEGMLDYTHSDGEPFPESTFSAVRVDGSLPVARAGSSPSFARLRPQPGVRRTILRIKPAEESRNLCDLFHTRHCGQFRYEVMEWKRAPRLSAERAELSPDAEMLLTSSKCS